MEEGKARLVVLIDPTKKAAFDAACAARDASASEVIRQLIEDYLARHGANYAPHGDGDGSAAAPGQVTSASGRSARSRPTA